MSRKEPVPREADGQGDEIVSQSEDTVATVQGAAKDPVCRDQDAATRAGAEASQPDGVAVELEKVRAEAAENYDRYLRAAAELDNLRKRTARVRSEVREDTLREVLLSIAPVLDNLQRALGQESPDAASLRHGIELIQGQLLDALKGFGLRPMEALGQPFDPNLHEAMLELQTSEHPPGIVVEETEKGYLLNSKLVRPARVIVSKSSE